MKATNSSTSVPHVAPVVNPLGVYTPAQAMALLGLAKSTIKAERRAGRLRVGKRGNLYYIMGLWLIEWLQAGELPSRRRCAAVDSEPAKEGTK